MKFRNRFMKYYIHANEAAAEGAADTGEADAGDDLAGGEGAAGGTPEGDAGGAGESANAAEGDVANAGGEGKGYWPDDWQDKFSKGDEKLKNIASRFASPEAMFEGFVAAQNRIRSGELKTALPKDAKPEELAQWRKDNGIPEKPEDYDLTFESGLVLGEDDMESVGEFLSVAHEHNMTPEQVKAAIEWNEAAKEAQIEARHEADENQRVAALDALNAEYGGNFRRNINMLDGVLSMMPEDVRDDFKSARLPDGTAVFNHPQIIRGLVAIANELNPAGVVAPAGGGDPMKGVNEEIAAIEKDMRTNRTAYNKDEAKQARYRELLVAREKMQARG